MSDASVDSRLADLCEAVERLTATVEHQQAQLATQRAELEVLRRHPVVGEPDLIEPRLRRRTLLGLGGVGVVGAVVGVSAQPAAAGTAVGAGTADGEAIGIGEANSGSTGTSLTITNATEPTLTVGQDGNATALVVDANGSGLGVSVTSASNAVDVTSTGAAGVDATGVTGVIGTASGGGTGVSGTGSSGAGVSGTATSGIGVDANATTGTGLDAFATSGAAVRAASTSGVGVAASGGRAPINLAAAGSSGEPASGAHTKGDLYVDSAGDLFLCTGSGSPGTWTQLNDQTTGTAVQLGASNSTTGTTSVSASAADALSGTTTSNGSSGVVGTADVSNGIGVEGSSSTASGTGVKGTANGGTAVNGVAGSGTGVSGTSSSGTGVSGSSTSGVGVAASGGRVPINLAAGGTNGAPSSGTHTRGDLYVDNTGDLHLCTATGSPGAWTQLNNQTTGDALQLESINNTTAVTTISTTGDSALVVTAAGASSAKAIRGVANVSNGMAIDGEANNATGRGVNGFSSSGTGVWGNSTNGTGVVAESLNGIPINLVPGGSSGAPGGTHSRGDLYLDSGGDLYLCTAAPSTWTKLNGQVTGGPFVALGSSSASASTTTVSSGGANALAGTTSSSSSTGVVGTATGGSGTGVAGVANVASGTGVSGTANNGTGTGVSGSSTNGTGVSATGATGLEASGTATGIDASGPTAVSATGTTTGIDASGPTAVSATGTTTGIDASGPTAVSATGTNFGINASGPIAVSATGTNVGVSATGTTAVTGGGTATGVVGTASSSSGTGVSGTANGGSGTGVRGSSTNGVGVVATGRIPLRLTAAGSSGAPSTGTHVKGDTYVDADGEMYICRVGGSPGNFSKLTNQNVPLGGDPLLIGKTTNIADGPTQLTTNSAFNSATFGVLQFVPSANDSPALLGQSNGAGAGVFGTNAKSSINNSTTNPGVFGSSTKGYGGEFTGDRAALRLIPKSGNGAPSSGRHNVGEFVVDAAGALWFCTKTGTPGTWTRLDGQPTFFAAPQRAYDSRADQSPTGNGPGRKGDLVGGTANNRVINLRSATDLPNNATAVIVNATLVGTAAGAGFLKLFKNGVSAPNASTMNWYQGGTIVANTTTVACDASQRIVANVSGPTGLIIDVIGYYT